MSDLAAVLARLESVEPTAGLVLLKPESFRKLVAVAKAAAEWSVNDDLGKCREVADKLDAALSALAKRGME